MRKTLVTLVVLAALLPAVAPAQDAAPAAPPAPAAPMAPPASLAEAAPAIQGVIGGQLDAFNARDVAGAWTHASPLIKGMFGSPEAFGTMVEQGYPMVWTNSDRRFLELRPEAGGLYQKVLVRDAEGRLWVLDYEMVPMPEGWQINGVQILPAPDVGA